MSSSWKKLQLNGNKMLIYHCQQGWVKTLTNLAAVLHTVLIWLSQCSVWFWLQTLNFICENEPEI